MQTGKISLDAAIDEEFRNDFAQNEGKMSLDDAIDEEFRSSFAQSEKTPIEKVSLDSAIDEEFSPKATPSEPWRGSLFGAGGFRGDMEAPAIKPRQEVPPKGNGGYSAKEMFLGTATNPSLRQSGVPSLTAGEKSSLSPQELSRSLLDQANAMSNAESTQEEQKESLLKKEILADELNKERSIMGRAAASGMGRQMGDVGYLANLLGASGLGDALQSEGSRLGENNPFTRPEDGWQKYAVSVAENLPFMAATMAGGVGAGALTSSAAAKLGAGKVLSTLAGLGAAGATRTAIEGAIEAGGAAGEASEMGMSKDEQRRVAGEVFGADFLKQTGLNAIEQVLELGGGSLKGLAPIAKLLGSKSGKALGVLGAGAIRGELEGLEEKMQEESVLDALGIDRNSPEGKARVAEARHMGRAMGWMFEATGLSLNGLTKVGDRMIDLGNKARKETPSDQKQAYEDIISKVESGNLTAEELIPYLTSTQKLGLASDAIQDLKDLRLRKRQGEELNEEEQSRLANLTEAIGLLSSEGEDAAISKMSEVFDVPEWVRSHMETETSPYMGTETGEVYVDSDQTAVVPRRNETAPATKKETPSSLVPVGEARRPLADMTLENVTEYTPEEIEANRDHLRRLLGKVTKRDLRERFGIPANRQDKKETLIDRVINGIKRDSEKKNSQRIHAIPMGGADQRSDTIIEQPSQRVPALSAGPKTPKERRASAETPTQGAIVTEGEGDPYYGEMEVDARPGTDRRAYRDKLKQHYNDKSQGVEIPVPGGGGGDAPPYPNPGQAPEINRQTSRVKLGPGDEVAVQGQPTGDRGEVFAGDNREDGSEVSLTDSLEKPQETQDKTAEFMDGASNRDKALVNKRLSKKINFEGKSMTKKDFVELLEGREGTEAITETPGIESLSSYIERLKGIPFNRQVDFHRFCKRHGKESPPHQTMTQEKADELAQWFSTLTQTEQDQFHEFIQSADKSRAKYRLTTPNGDRFVITKTDKQYFDFLRGRRQSKEAETSEMLSQSPKITETESVLSAGKERTATNIDDMPAVVNLNMQEIPFGNLPDGWIVLNSQRPLPGHKTAEGKSLYGKYYSAIDTKRSDAGNMLSEAKTLDAKIVVTPKDAEDADSYVLPLLSEKQQDRYLLASDKAKAIIKKGKMDSLKNDFTYGQIQEMSAGVTGKTEPYDDSGYDLLPRPERGDFDTDEDYESALNEWEDESSAEEISPKRSVETGESFSPGSPVVDSGTREGGVQDVPTGESEKPDELDDGKPDGDVDSGHDRRGRSERLVTSREQFVPDVDESTVPGDIQRTLRPHQRQGAAMMLRAMEKFGGGILADGTGAGKTRQILAVAETISRSGRPVVIIAPSGVIKPQWSKGVFSGSYVNDGKDMNVSPNLYQNGPISEGIHLSTYERLSDILSNLPKNASVIFDEAHYLKNAGSGTKRALRGLDIAKKAQSVLFVTATPADKVLQIEYLQKADVFEGRTKAEQFTALGLRKEERRIKGRSIVQWVVPSGKGPTVMNNLNKLFARLTQRGIFLKRELSLSDENGGVQIFFDDVKLSDEGKHALADVQRTLGDPETASGLEKARILMTLRRRQEPYKVEPAIKLAKEAFAKGHKVVFFVSRVNDSTLSEGDEADTSISPITVLKEELSKIGLRADEIAEIHGNISKPKQLRNMESFQNGNAKAVIATMESGGTGINLDDTVGSSPRTMIILTAPFSAVENVQAIGRVWRLNTKSYPEIHYLTADTNVDQWNMGLIQGKMKSLNAVVRGEVKNMMGVDEEKADSELDSTYDPREDNAKREIERKQNSEAPKFFDVTGNTFPVKEDLKQLGAKWQPQKKAWRVPGNKGKELKAFLAEHQGLKASNMEALTGEEQYQVQKESTETSAPPITKQSVESSFPGATVTEQDDGSFVVETPNGQVITVQPDATITMDKDAASKAYGREMGDSDEAVGSFQSINGEGVIRLTDKADQGTLDHETWHAAKSFVISEEDAATLKKDYANEEQEAEAYRQWVAGRRAKTTKRSGRIFQKILDFFSRIKANLFGKNSEDIFREVATGEAWGRKSRGQSPSEEQYSVKDAGDSETWQPIVDKMEGERVVRPTKEKKTIKERLKEGVEAIYDGYVDELLPLARAFGDKVYDLARVSLRGTSGPAMQMIERGSVDGKTKGLYKIFESLPKGEADGFMHYATYKHLLDVAENSENARQAQIELGKLASQAKKEASAMERRAAKEPKGSSDFKALQDQAKEARERAKALEKQADDLDSRIKKTVLNSTSYKWGIAELEKAYPHWKEAQRDLAQYSKEILGVLNEAGIISDKLKNELNQRYPNYVPLQRDFGDEETVNAFIRTKGLVNLGTPIKKLKGSDRDVIDPVRQIIENTFRAYVLKGQNDVAREIVKQVDEGVIPEEVIKPTEDRHHGPTEHVFYVWEDGEKRLFKTDADIYHALMMTGSRHPGVKQTVFEAIAKYPTKAIRIGATRTVGFALRNMYRDNLHAGVVSENGFVPFYDGVRGLFHVLTKSDLYDEFLRSGGAMGTINAVDRNYFQEEYDKVRELDLDHPTVKNMRKKAWRFLSDIVEASENATRMGEYMRAKENGKSIKEAALSARDLQDFERGGERSKSINSFSAFFNAGLQGMDKLIRAHGFPDMMKAFRETEGGIKATEAALEAFRWKTAVRATMFLSLPSILTAMFNLADDDRKKAYLELPAWRKDLFWNIVLDPGDPDTGDKGFVLSLPKPFELGVLYGSIPERFAVWLHGKDKKAFDGLGESLGSTFPSVFPNFLVIPWELASNKSLFLGRNIVPQSEQKLSPGRQSGPYTSEFAKWGGRTFNVSPRKIDYTLRSTFSSLGGDVLKASDSVIQGLRGDPRPEVPAKEKYSFGFVNQGYKSPQSVQDFYDGLDDLETRVNDAKDKAKEGEPLEGRDKTAFRLGQKDSYTKDPAPLTRLRRIRTGIGQLSRDKSIIAERKGMTAEEKRREIDLIDARILSMARQGNTYIEELVKAVEND